MINAQTKIHEKNLFCYFLDVENEFIMISCQINQYNNKHSEIHTNNECIIPTCEELNYETSQVQCPHRYQQPLIEKCQKNFKNIMALNVHLQMYHKETGILTVRIKRIF